MIKLFIRLVKHFGYDRAKRLAPGLGISNKTVKEAYNKMVLDRGMGQYFSSGGEIGQAYKTLGKEVRKAYPKRPSTPYKKGGTFQQRKGMRELQQYVDELKRTELAELGGYQAGGGVQGEVTRAEIIRTLLEGGRVSPKVSRAGIRKMVDY